MRRSTRAVAALAVVLGVAEAAAARAQQAPEPASLAPVETPSPAAFGLGLANLSGPWPDRFLLFPDFWAADAVIAVHGVPTAWGGARGPAPQQLVGLRAIGLGVRLGEEVGPDGRRRLVFAPMHRDWDDLSGWEKFGLTLQYAGAAAAIGHFVGKLVD